MIHIGVSQELEILEQVRGGYMVGDEEDAVFLNTPRRFANGQRLMVFVYTDKEGQPLATTEQPLAECGQFAFLEVVDVSAHGAYLNWGLKRDLFVPFGLQHDRLRIGERVVVAVGLDAQDRVYASSKLGDFLDRDPRDLYPGQPVSLLVYGFNDLGALVVIEGRYAGMIYHNMIFKPVRLGDQLEGWIDQIREDGRVDVSLQRGSWQGTLDAREVVWQRLLEGDGFLALTDKSDPSLIRAQLQMSKKAFKKAIGSLYRERKVVLTPEGIRVVSGRGQEGG